MSLADKQRRELIKERGEPILRLEFDVFADESISMCTHFEHGSDFALVKDRLIAIRDHLSEFIRDQNLCPFHQSETQK